MAGSSTLSDLRVIECAEGVAGPCCGKLLAGLGATGLAAQVRHSALKRVSDGR